MIPVKCSECGAEFETSRLYLVHCKEKHGIGKNNAV